MEEHAAGPEPGGLSPLEKAWDELHRLAQKHREASDPDIALALEQTMVGRAQSLALSAKTKPGWLAEFPMLASAFTALPTQEDDAAQAPVATVPSEPAKPDDLELAEKFIREAHIASMRGDRAKAKELLDEAEKAAPHSATVLVALGDAAIERHNQKEALRLYDLAKAAEPGNVAIERKHAETAFRISQGTIFDPTIGSQGVEAVASAKAAVVLSVFLPGLGQMVTGEVAKGIAMMVAWAGGWVWALLLGFNGLFGMIGLRASKEANPTVLLPLAIAILSHMIAIFDAAAKAKTAERRKILRPPPPDEGKNLPFE